MYLLLPLLLIHLVLVLLSTLLAEIPLAVQQHLEQVGENLNTSLDLSLHQLDNPLSKIPVKREPFGIIVVVGRPLYEIMRVENVFLPQEDFCDLEEGVTTIEFVQLWIDLVAAAILEVCKRLLVASVSILNVFVFEAKNCLGGVEIALHQGLLYSERLLVILCGASDDFVEDLYCFLHVSLVIGAHGDFHTDLSLQVFYFPLNLALILANLAPRQLL
jgi:hypothetical protein